MATTLPTWAKTAFASAADVSSFTSGQSDRLTGIDTNYTHCDVFVHDERKLQLSPEFLRFNNVSSFPISKEPTTLSDEISQRWLPVLFLIIGLFCGGQLRNLFRALYNRIWRSLIFSLVLFLAHGWPADAAGYDQKTPTHSEVKNFTEGKSDRLYGVDEPRNLRHSASKLYEKADKVDQAKNKVHPVLLDDPSSKHAPSSTPDGGMSNSPIQVWPHIPNLQKGTSPYAPTLHLKEAVQLKGKLLKTNK